MDADGRAAERVRLTRTPNVSESAPDWSPDGTRIAFERRLPRADGGRNYEVFVMDADGTDKTNISRNPASAESAPAYSPDGGQIAFVSDRANLGLEEGWEDIWKMGADGSDPTRVTDYYFFEVAPDWQPAP